MICAPMDREVMKVEEAIDSGAGPTEPRPGVWNFQSPANGKRVGSRRGLVVYCLGDLHDVFAGLFENM